MCGSAEKLSLLTDRCWRMCSAPLWCLMVVESCCSWTSESERGEEKSGGCFSSSPLQTVWDEQQVDCVFESAVVVVVVVVGQSLAVF